MTNKKTTQISTSTTPSEDYLDKIRTFLFEGVHGDELQLSQSGRLRLVVEAHLVVDGNDYPVKRLASTTWPPKDSLAKRVSDYARAWSERVQDPLSTPEAWP